MRIRSNSERLAGYCLLTVTVIGWGVSWPIFKQVLLDWPPLFARGIAGLLGATALAALAVSKGRSLCVPRETWMPLATAAFFNVFVWMGFTSISLRWLSVSEAALLTYSMPLWTVLLAWPMLGQRPDVRDLLAVLLGVSGIVVLVAGPGVTMQIAKVPGVAFALMSAVLFATGTLRAGRALPIDSIVATAWQVAIGCLALVVLGLLFESPNFTALSPRNVAGLAFVASVSMAVCYLSWFGALRRIPASSATMGTLLVPVVGTVAAAWWLNETLAATVYVAFGLVLSGVALAISKKRAIT